jgi:hypothetical protein
MNRKYLETVVDNLTVGTHKISNELKDYLNDDYYCEDKVNDNLVLYSLDGNDKYGLVIDNEIIVSDDYFVLHVLFEQKSKDIENLPKSIQLLLEYGLTTKQAYEIHELIKKEILEK